MHTRVVHLRLFFSTFRRRNTLLFLIIFFPSNVSCVQPPVPDVFKGDLRVERKTWLSTLSDFEGGSNSFEESLVTLAINPTTTYGHSVAFSDVRWVNTQRVGKCFGYLVNKINTIYRVFTHKYIHLPKI
jgi:hypothetical protein